MKTGKKAAQSILLVIMTFAFGIVLGLWQVKPPRVNETSPQYPVYQRMMANIQKMAVEPHVSGSAEIELVRSQILAEIEEMGLTPMVEEEIYTATELADEQAQAAGAASKEEWWEWNKDWIEENYDIHSVNDWFSMRLGGDDTLPLQNILVKMDAPNTDRGVMFVSHYDSTKGGPGAADDMVAVCSMLEAMRAQTQNGALQNDIYFLITDGEEKGLLGAKKFVKAHPELNDSVDMVVNLEARGNRGGLLLFETSPKAYPLIQHVVRSGAQPIGMSWAAAVYAMMPNITDLTAFFNGGFNGINFAAIEGVETYHQPTDTYENLDRNTAWQYLRTTLSFADYAARSDLGDLQKQASEGVYFPFLPGILVLMNSLISHLLCAAACLLAVGVIMLRAKKKQLKVSFSIILMGLLILLSIGSAVFFASGSYLFYIPLLVMAVTAFLKKLSVAHTAARAVSGIIVLLVWVPVVFLLWVSMIQPMML